MRKPLSPVSMTTATITPEEEMKPRCSSGVRRRERCVYYYFIQLTINRLALGGRLTLLTGLFSVFVVVPLLLNAHCALTDGNENGMDLTWKREEGQSWEAEMAEGIETVEAFPVRNELRTMNANKP